jgi:hypothetical protein
MGQHEQRIELVEQVSLNQAHWMSHNLRHDARRVSASA